MTGCHPVIVAENPCCTTKGVVQCIPQKVTAFNDTMLKIWQEQITLLGVIDTGALLASPKALPLRADGRFFEVGLSQSFLEICD